MRFSQLAKLYRHKLVRESFVVGGVYLAAAKIGLTTAFTAQQVTLVWPPTGIALGVLMLVGPDLWPGILFGAFVANIASRNTLEAMTAAWLMRQFVTAPMSQSWERGMLAVVVFGGLTSTTISATIGATSFCASGLQPWSSFWSMWRTWWLGNAAG